MSDGSHLAVLTEKSTRRHAIANVLMAYGGLALVSTQAWGEGEKEISHTAESIHQEILFKAGRKRIYEALTIAKQFDQVLQLSEARRTRMQPGAPPAQINPEEGGLFSTFGGIIVGRNIELVPYERIVQAWRPAYWKPGVY